MARRGSADVAFVLMSGWDVRGTLTAMAESKEAVIEQTDTLGDTWQEHSYVGVRRGTLQVDGFFDDNMGTSADAVPGHGALTTGPGTAKVLCYGLDGTATGAEFVGWSSGMQAAYTCLAERGALHKVRANFQTAGPIDVGKILRTWKVHTATGDATDAPVDWAVSTTGGAAYLQYSASAGEANIRVLHSSDNITYATLFTFTKTASGRSAERLTTTGVIERYTAVGVTTASATGAIAALNTMVGLARGLTT